MYLVSEEGATFYQQTDQLKTQALHVWVMVDNVRSSF